MLAQYSRIGFTLCVLAVLASGCAQPLTPREKSVLLVTALGMGAGALFSGGNPTSMLTAGLVSGAAGLLAPRLLGALDGSSSPDQSQEVENLKRELAWQKQELERLQHGEEPLDDEAPDVTQSSFRRESVMPDENEELFSRRPAPSLDNQNSILQLQDQLHRRAVGESIRRNLFGY